MTADDVVNRKQRWVLIGVAAAIAVVAAVLVGVVVTRDDDGEATTTTTSTTSAPSTSSSTTSTLPTTTSTLPVTAEEIAHALYPDLASGSRFSDPVAVAMAFATQFLQFDTDVVLGEYQSDDNRSGQFAAHPPGSTTITTIGVRQLTDDSWAVLSAVSESTIRIDTPTPGATISSPVRLTGAALAPEGHVDVMLYVDGEPTPIATGFVTGRGDGVMGAFDKPLGFPAPSGARTGTLVLSAPSAEDGTTLSATATRVRF